MFRLKNTKPRQILTVLFISLGLFYSFQLARPAITYAAPTQAECEADKEERLLGLLPKWYKYLPYESDEDSLPADQKDQARCSVHFDFRDTKKWAAVLPIGLVVLEMLLTIAGVVSVGYVIYGGFRYLTSQGEPEHTKAAFSTIINALIGGAIAIIATSAVAFLAGRFT